MPATNKGSGVLTLFENWDVTLDNLPAEDLMPACETAIWHDEYGPLVISRIDTSGKGGYRLRMGDDIAVDVHPERRIVARFRPEVSRTTVDHFLADQILPRVLASEGQFILHSGAVRMGDGAILLMGPSGRGKSTLVTSFDRAGLSLMGDDAMTISWSNGQAGAKPVYPSLRLLPDSIEALLPDTVTTTSVAYYTAKRRVTVPVADTNGATPLPIQAIFLIAEPIENGKVGLRSLTIAEACMALVESSFALDPTDVIQARGRLADASELARNVPMFEIRYPRDYAQLPEVRAAILAQVAALETA